MTAPTIDLALRSRRVVLPDGVRPATVLVADGRIIAIAGEDELQPKTAVTDLGDLVLMPGLVDSHVHINEPGRTAWEGFDTATRAAAAGGITTLADMPLNSTPVTTTVEALETKLAAARGQLHVDCGFLGGLIPGNLADLEPLMDAGVMGFKAFLIDSGIDDFPAVISAELQAAMPLLAARGYPLLVHAEVGFDFGSSNGDGSYAAYLESRPRSWENDAIRMLVKLCQDFGCPVHIVHLSSADALPIIARGRRNGWPLTVETCPHYLFFDAEEIEDGDTRMKCAPPIRERENRERLWKGLSGGLIDAIVSDHSPCTPDLKQLGGGNFRTAWGGIASLQFTLSAVWTEARERGHSLTEIARWMCAKPAELLGLTGRKGALRPGYDADMVVWDPDAEFTVTQALIKHKHPVTPYQDRILAGTVMATYLRGRKIYAEGDLLAPATGEILLRQGG